MKSKALLWLGILETAAVVVFILSRTLFNDWMTNAMAALVVIYTPIVAVLVWLLRWVGRKLPSAGEVFSFLAGSAFVLAGIGIFGWQILTWLKSGRWHSLPLHLLWANDRSEFRRWLDEPQSWYGLHTMVLEILNLVPISVLSISLGLAILCTRPER